MIYGVQLTEMAQNEEENLCLIVFHFSLMGDALKWLNTHPSQSFTILGEMLKASY